LWADKKLGGVRRPSEEAHAQKISLFYIASGLGLTFKNCFSCHFIFSVFSDTLFYVNKGVVGLFSCRVSPLPCPTLEAKPIETN